MSVVFEIHPDLRFRLSTAAGGETSFSVPFPFQANVDIAVVKIAPDGTQTELNEPTNYTLTGAGSSSGGTAWLTSPATKGDVYLRVGRAILERVLSVVRNGQFKSKAIDDDLDRFIIIAQELAREDARTLKVAYGKTPPKVTLGTEHQLLAFDGSGNLVPVDPLDITARGPWENAPTTYTTNNIVEHGGSLYIAKRDNSGVEPGTPAAAADWSLLLTGVTAADGSITLAKLSPDLQPLMDANQLPQRALMGSQWGGGVVGGTDTSARWRQPALNDLQHFRSGTFGDKTLLGWLRLLGIPIEADYYDANYLDASLAAITLMQDANPRVVLFPEPPYLFDTGIPPGLSKGRTFVSHTAGITSPPTIIMENPAHRALVFDATDINVRFRGVFKIRHRIKPANNSVPTVDIQGGANIEFDTLVVENATQALRFSSGGRVHIKHLVTIDCDEAILAQAAAAGNLFIERHTKLGSGAQTITGGVNINALSWTPTFTFSTPGDLSVSYATRVGLYERHGSLVYIKGSVVCTPTYTTASGQAQITGLPFQVSSGFGPDFIGLSSLSAFTWPGTLSGLFLSATAGAKTLALQGQGTGVATTNVTNSNIPSGNAVTLRFSGVYKTEE